MPLMGWKQLITSADRYKGEGNCPIAAYSEFMPPPQIGTSLYSGRCTGLFADDDPWGWPVTEYEEQFQLIPGLHSAARQIMDSLLHLVRGSAAHGIALQGLTDNPCWPEELARCAAGMNHEHFVLILPLALARTQDDKGRTRWTIFGASEQGPARAFWKSFYTDPEHEIGAEPAIGSFVGLVREVFNEPIATAADLHRCGFRIFARDAGPDRIGQYPASMPSWTAQYLWQPGQTLDQVRFLLSFEPFSDLPENVRKAYLAGALHLLPFPGCLLFWGFSGYRLLQRELPVAQQIPLLHCLARHEGPQGMRIPQSGWLHEPGPQNRSASDRHGPVRNSYIRTHRWARVHRHDDEIAILAREDKLVHVLFSTQPDDVELYGKPMARNVQIWTHDHHLLLNGPRASRDDIERAFRAVGEGGMFGYRFQFPAMRLGAHEVYWHRPLIAYLAPDGRTQTVVGNPPAGYMTAYPADAPEVEHAAELWPRILERPEHVAAIQLFDRDQDTHPHKTALNIRKLLDVAAYLAPQPVPRSCARRLIAAGADPPVEDWLESLPGRAHDSAQGRRLAESLEQLLEKKPALRGRAHAPESLTFDQTANRRFEVRYWNTIRCLSAGQYVNKCNADCVHDAASLKLLRHRHRDLEALGDYLLAYYRETLAASRLGMSVLIGELPFRWRTDFDFGWSGGWSENQKQRTHERNLCIVIPGSDRGKALIMADHYDTAYMEDAYDRSRGGSGARIAAAGADDNHSATAALMLAAPVLMRLSREGKLGCDVWLVHLTGEEFPSDCMGARHLSSSLVERTLKLDCGNGRFADLSRAQVAGVYVLDMIAHNNDRARNVFQIAPGAGAGSLRLAIEAHFANEIWNLLTRVWNRRSSRRGRGSGLRSADGATVPAIAEHPQLSGEVRLQFDPRSTLFNTDGQIFSDAGIPVVLFMENYDINRVGYHDSHDTMENIDLDYGAAIAAVAIESVARASQCAPSGKS